MNTEKVDVESVRVVDPPMLPAHANGAKVVGRTPAAPAVPARSHGWLWLLVTLLVLAVGGWFAYPYILAALQPTAAKGRGRGAMRGAPVVVATAYRGDMPLYIDEIGTVTALNTVTVHTRVDGELDKVAFVEGQLVHQGDLLAEIDPRPFQVQLTQAEGQLARDQAQLDNAKVDLKRYQDAEDAVSRQQLDTATATVAQDEGNVKTDQGAIDSAKLQLAYCRVTAPLTGKIGFRNVDVGNIVHASDANGIAVIAVFQPIDVVFSVKQADVPPILEKMNAGQKLEVDAFDEGLTKKLAVGELAAADSTIDQTTSSLRFKAVFSNQDNRLYPNQFVNVRLLIDTKRDVVIVPTAAVQSDAEQNPFIYVVKKEGPATAPAGQDDGAEHEKGAAEEAPAEAKGSGGTGAAGAGSRRQAPERVVEMRKVTIGEQQGDESVITSGVDAGEVVVTDGVDKLQDGSKVTIGRDATTQPATQAAAGEATEAGGATQPGASSARHWKRPAQ
jgi:multidrug efflux system membrane fusion protein